MEGASILGHIYMSTMWPRKHGNLNTELGDCAQQIGLRGKTMQLVYHVGSLVEGIGNEGSTVTWRYASRYLHVCLHLRCNPCLTGVSRLGVGMVTGGDYREHILLVVV